MIKKFYYVHNRGKGNPTVRHETIEQAIEEAIRLSKLTKKNFYILKPVGHITEKGRVIAVEESNNYLVKDNMIFIEKKSYNDVIGELDKKMNRYQNVIDKWNLCEPYYPIIKKWCDYKEKIKLFLKQIYQKSGLKYIVNLIIK